ncbi:cellulase family glycosylhydrolase [Lentisphaera profundi]|uniref:Cellulase family glycosylhydrolase n=1 Tax=Lentisphaera profundi TaxID=1658616 RepID=A0ABY7W394_9BACT|nr:cellulase family glycosylhydrolase [Lentisphaera profundi]WDE99461.1 cellulase family glycosylhydrolase [Lentisphaera profundi]
MNKPFKSLAYLGVLILLSAGCTSFQSTASNKATKTSQDTKAKKGYTWTTDHVHVGVRWQPFGGFPKYNAADAQRPVIAQNSSYAQFWINWHAAEPDEKNTDYKNNLSGYLQTIEQAVDACNAKGLKVEFVHWHTPAWASVNGEAGSQRSKPGLYKEFVTRLATHFKGRVHAYQLSHEANLEHMINEGDMDYLMNEIFIDGAKAIRSVYQAEPSEEVLISTSGCSPCEPCPPLNGLKGKGGAAVDDYYDQLIANEELMSLVDALNLNVTDHSDGYGKMDGKYLDSTWGNFDLVRHKLDAAGYKDKQVLSSESWVVWDDGDNAFDVNGDGLKNEVDAYEKTLTILGKCLERGLNTVNLPWSDNSSGWSMGLTKRRDFSGRVKLLNPGLVVPANDGGSDIITKKVILAGPEDKFKIIDAKNNIFTIDDYINPSDPNHLHYYIWKWYSQLSSGKDEVIRHAMAHEHQNHITLLGPAFTGNERYRISSYNRSKQSFSVLLYASGATGKLWNDLTIPATIQTGIHSNTGSSKMDFRGEGFKDGEKFIATITTKDISKKDGSDIDKRVIKTAVQEVKDGQLKIRIPVLNKFTHIEFNRSE